MSATTIKFGTDGWRSRMDVDFDVNNVTRIADSVSKYLKGKHGAGRVVVGYDTRRNSSVFAEAAGSILASRGFQVSMTVRPTPTPVVAYSVVSTRSLGAVQITASHNPPVYNGFKFIPDYGGPAFPEITAELERNLPEQPPQYKWVKLEGFDPKQDYIDFLLKNVDLGDVKGMNIVVDPMYGAGYGYVAQILSGYGAKTVEIHELPDPAFGGLNPEPNEENTRQLAKKVVDGGFELGVANDGDADRFGAIDSKGRHYPSNKLVLVIADYLFRVKGVRKKIARSISVTQCVDTLCRKFGVEPVVTPVGFKYLAKELMSGAIIGVEESGGIGYGWSTPEKDGVMSSALLCEAVSKQGYSLGEIWERVAEDYGFGDYLQFNLPAEEPVKQRLAKVKEKPPETFAGSKVASVTTIDGLKLSLDDDSWVLMRPSGTEPLIRIYIESSGKARTQEIADAAKKILY
ncbi:MAG: phosphoglucomutase/phosphomannomutase family protein [Candidatus Marsarchaeota archaeon]|nr:phosphoglucomutase/phosphomannomutase family protein [Candidatus Marsarchaeota archaeon]